MGNIMNKKLYDVAMIGSSLATSQYFGDYDHSFNAEYFAPVDYMQYQSGGESVMIGMFEDDNSGIDNVSYVVVSFKGMDGMEPSLQLGDFSDCVMDTDNIVSTLRSIEESAKRGCKTVEDCGNSNKFCCMNEHLMDGCDEFESGSFGLSDEIIDWSERCDAEHQDDASFNNGKQCELCITGHSRGGVFAVATAVKMRQMLCRHFSDWSHQPHLMTFGMPPPFLKNNLDCKGGVLNDHDKLLNFVNMLREPTDFPIVENWVHMEMDVAFIAGLEANGKHKGTNIIISNGASSITSWDAEDFGYPRCDHSSLEVQQEDLLRLLAHQAELCRDNLRHLESFNNLVMEGGFGPGSPCFLNEHCGNPGDCGTDETCK